MFKLFTRKQKTEPAGAARRNELAAQLTAAQRMALAQPGVPPAGLSYATYDAMQQDAMVQTALTVKKLGVLAADWRLEPADGSDEARRVTDFVAENFAAMQGSPQTILYAAMDALAKGWSVQELLWEARAGRWWLGAARPKDPAHFGLEVDAFGRVSRLRLQLPGEPVREIPRAKFVIHRHRVGYGRPKGQSDLDAAYRHYSAKQTLLAAWKLHLERFASPTVLGRFQRGMPAEEQAAMLGALQDLAHHTAIVFPDELSIDTLGGGKDGSAGFLEAIEFHNREIARSILGQTLTTDEGKRVGSLALGKVHLQVLLMQLEGLRSELADSVMTEQVIRPLVEVNFGRGLVPRFVFERSLASVFARGEV